MKALILVKNAGQVIPAGFLERSVPTYDTCSGAAYFVTQAGVTKLVCAHYDEPTTVKEIQDFMDKRKDEPAMFVLGKHDGTMMKEDQQPFVLFKNADGSPAILCAIEGNYDNMKKPESAHTGEYFVAHTQLIPLISPSFKGRKGDTAKVFEDLDNPIITETIKGFAQDRGVVTLMDSKGTIFSVCTDNAVENGYTWGFSSQLFDGDGVHRVDPAKPTKFGEGETYQPPAPAVPSVPLPSPDDKPIITDTAINDEMVELWPKSKGGHHVNNREKKDFYRGYFPIGKLEDITADWKEGTPIKVKRSAVKPQHLWQLAITKDSVLKPAAAAPAKDTPKDMKTPELSGFQKMELAASIPDTKEQNNMLQLMASPYYTKLVAASSEHINDPKKWAEGEERKPKFTEHLALQGLDEVMYLPDEILEQICKGFPKYGRMLINELRLEVYNLREQMRRAGTVTTVKKDDDKKAEPAAQVQKVANLNDLQPMAL